MPAKKEAMTGPRPPMVTLVCTLVCCAWILSLDQKGEGIPEWESRNSQLRDHLKR
jgi:hypothetical protein